MTYPNLKILTALLLTTALSASANILLDIGQTGKPAATAADFASAGVTGLSGSEPVGNLTAATGNDAATTFTFTNGATMSLSARCQGAWSKDLGNEMLNDYLYLQQNTSNGGPLDVSLGNIGLTPGTTYTLYLFGAEGSANERSAFTPVDNPGISFDSTSPSDGNLTVRFSTSASYSGQPVQFIWARAAGSPNFAVFNGIAIRPGAAGVGQGAALTWKCSTDSSRWSDQAEVPLGESIAFADSAASRIVVNSGSKLQRIDGWGACFNERGWKAMEILPQSARDALMNEFFHPTSGLKLGLCRTPIGASDYAVDLYSLNESAGDHAMADFSIERDRQRLIPFIKAARAIRPDLKIWASPWSPPSWMKNNNRLYGPGASNSIKDDARTFDALALYFARYIESYAAEGIPIRIVMPQNEPNMTTNYTSCLWTGTQLARFIGYHLGPTLATRGLATEIYLGTINDDNDAGGYAYWVEPSMRDPNVLQYLDGLGCQWDSDDTMAETHVLHPQMKLMQTEAECGNHENNWTFAEYQWGLAQKWFASGANSNIVWNLVLDETGLSTGGWAQCSPVVVDSTSGQVTYTPYFHLYKHFSHFVEPGAHVAASYGSWGDRIAFTNPDGSVVIVLANRTNNNLAVTLNIDGKRTAPITIPARSFNTFTTTAPAAQPLSGIESWRDYHFGNSGNEGSSSDTADPDADGMSNAVEFSLGLDPTAPQPAPIVGRKVSETFEFIYQRNKAAMDDGVAFIVEWSDTLENGSWSNSGVSEEIIAQDAWLQQVKALVPASTGSRFARLRVEL